MNYIMSIVHNYVLLLTGLKVHALHIAFTYSATAIKVVHGKFITRSYRELLFHQVNVAAQNTGHPDALDHGGAE